MVLATKYSNPNIEDDRDLGQLHSALLSDAPRLLVKTSGILRAKAPSFRESLFLKLTRPYDTVSDAHA